jgi:lipid II:glycine glycyltransferase (peptidoglycan interpeptide bridge formation enzyme)
MSSSKPRVVKDYDKLLPEIKEQIKLAFPSGFHQHLVSYTNKDGIKVSALPFETDDFYYLVRMTAHEARIIIEEDDDFDDDGILKEDVKEEFKEKFADVDYMSDYMDEDEGSDDDDIDDADDDDGDDDEE